MENYSGMINSNNDKRDWFQNLYESLNNAKQQEVKRAANSNIFKYADVSCHKCQAAYMKDYVVNSLRGVCEACGGTEWSLISNKEEPKKKEEKIFECTGCDKTYDRKNLKKGFKCACGASKFISSNLLDAVTNNTIEFYKESKNIRLEDVWHEKGKVFASFFGEANNGGIWKTAVAASGKFTKNDFIIFDINEEGGQAAVATYNGEDHINKFAQNESCSICWDTDGSDIDETENRLSSIVDSDGRQIRVGSKLEWYTKKGPFRGEVVEAKKDGTLVVGMTYDEYGPAKNSEFCSMSGINQDSINSLGIKTYY